MDSDIIKEFLVGLGFKVDAQGLKHFNSTIASVTKGAIGLGVAVTAAATATVAAVGRVSEQFEDLYYASQRIRASVGNIQSFDFAIGQVGGTAEEAMSSLEGLASFIRSNPGAEKFIQSIGIETRDSNNQLRDTTKIMGDLGAKFRAMPFYRAKVYAGILGIDEKTLMAMIRGIDQFKDKYSQLYKSAGVDPEKAALQATQFMNRLRDLRAEIEVLALVFAQRLEPMARGFIWIMEKLIQLVEWLDQHTDGLSTALIGLGVGFGIASKAASVFGVRLGALAVAAIPRLLLTLAMLTETALPALSAAFLAVGAAIEATPVGWIITALAAIGFAGYELWKHWKDIGPFFSGLWTGIKKAFSDGWEYIRPIVHALGLVMGQDWGNAPLPGRPGGAPDGAGAGGTPAAGGASPGAAGGAGAGIVAGMVNGGKAALDFFKKAGWSAAQAAGIVANIGAESGFDHRASGDHGQAFGLGQWHRERQDAFKRWAGHDIRNSTFGEQLAFVNYELTQGTERMAGRILKATGDAFSAGAVVSRYYERPRDAMGQMNARGASAQDWFNNGLRPGAGSAKTINATVNSHADIHVHGSTTPAETGNAVAHEQSRVAGDAVRNLKGAVR